MKITDIEALPAIRQAVSVLRELEGHGLVEPAIASGWTRGFLTDWDIDGIWNAEQAYGVRHTVENYLLYYVDSIDSVYLAPDGRLHDPTGYGFADATTKTLRLNTYDRLGRTPSPKDEVYVCLEGCRRPHISHLQFRNAIAKA